MSLFFFFFFQQLGIFLNTMKRILDVLHCRVEEILKSWASYLPVGGEKKSLFGEQMNGITVLLRTKYKNYLQAIVGKLISNVSSTDNSIAFEFYPKSKVFVLIAVIFYNHFNQLATSNEHST